MQIQTMVRQSIFAAALLTITQAGVGATVTFVGYTGDASADQPTSTMGTIVSAKDARSNFLGALGGNYFYEDFQNQFRPGNNGDRLNTISGGPYQLSWDHAGGPVAFASSNFDLGVLVRLGQTSTGSRGDFNAFDNTLASPTGGTLLTPDNWYLDMRGDPTNAQDTILTFTFAPGQRAVGLMLNDLVQPSKKSVAVTFSDGTTTILDTLGSVSGTLTTNNTWFLGIIGDQSISRLQIITDKNGDPVTIDNIYVSGMAVPLPSAVWQGAALMTFLGVGSLVRRKLHPC